MRTGLPCLPLIQERFWNEIKDNFTKENKRYHPEFAIDMYLQTWGSTSLGFDGIGGQAITHAYTTVVIEIHTGWYGVFFGEKLAYKIKDPNQLFYEDLKNHCMRPVRESSKYFSKNCSNL